MTCRSCGSTTESVLRLGDQKLADFRDDHETPPCFPLNLEFCGKCGLAQLDTTVPRSLMYHERYGFKSGVNETIRNDLRAVVEGARKRHRDPLYWLDIASNDGTLLSYVPNSIERTGIDPVQKYCVEAKQHADLIVNDFFKPQHFYHTFDVITSVSMFYDIDDVNGFVEDVKTVLAPEGLWVIQQNYLADTLRLNAVDNICHEHITYFSLWALTNLLDRHGLEVFDIEFSAVNGGCIRTYVGRKGVFPVQDRVAEQGQWELLNAGLNTREPFDRFADRVWTQLDQLRSLVDDANDRGEQVAVYGASTRGGTVWQAAGFDNRDFVYAVDRNPEKHGKVMSSIDLPIVSEQQARSDRPDYMVASIWFFRDQIVQRESEYLAAGGRLVFPLPELEVVGA